MEHAQKLQSDKGIFLAKVLSNRPICSQHYKLILEIEDFPPAQAGQFVQILCAPPNSRQSGPGPLLRRPFSIGGLRRNRNRCQIDIYQRVVGVGTGWLAQLKPGEPVSILGPLGKPFPIFEDKPSAYIVSGGCGLPPLIWLAQILSRAGKQTMAFCGAVSADMFPLTRSSEEAVTAGEPTLAFEEFAQFNIPMLAATDDGTLGVRGVITDLFADYLQQHPQQNASTVVYTCGPNPMMKTVVDLCQPLDVPCLVSLERMMACGMGTCQSCVVAVRDPNAQENWSYQLCCSDGPVFDSRQVIWDQPGTHCRR
ncbi:MAG: dihydroorotate dehydrogenase electron transfer subunit [Planctomycetota bacterium]|jgi:dihydroorotate dehydrogenase electron transfer subunit